MGTKGGCQNCVDVRRCCRKSWQMHGWTGGRPHGRWSYDVSGLQIDPNNFFRIIFIRIVANFGFQGILWSGREIGSNAIVLSNWQSVALCPDWLSIASQIV